MVFIFIFSDNILSGITHQPVCLRAAVGGGIQAVVFRAVLQFLQTFSYGLVSKRGDPQASERFRAAQKVVYPAEDKFPFAII